LQHLATSCLLSSPIPGIPMAAWGLPCRPRCSTNCTTVPAIFAVLQMRIDPKGHSLDMENMERKAKKAKGCERNNQNGEGKKKTKQKKTSMDSNSSNRHQQTGRKQLHYGSQSALFGPPSLGHLASSPGQNRHRDRHLHLSHLFETQCLCVSNVTSFSCVHWKPTARAT
jgi:hypothetical protein